MQNSGLCKMLGLPQQAPRNRQRDKAMPPHSLHLLIVSASLLSFKGSWEFCSYDTDKANGAGAVLGAHGRCFLCAIIGGVLRCPT